MKKFAIILFNLVWGSIALGYDLPALREMPIWSWPFCVICPLYPALLAWAWYQVFSKGSLGWLGTVAAVGALVYGILAILFYPAVMVQEGAFSWLLFGSLAWVLVYGIQGAYLLFTYHPVLPAIAAGWVCVSLAVHFVTKGYGYLEVDSLPTIYQAVLLAVGVCASMLGFFLPGSRKSF